MLQTTRWATAAIVVSIGLPGVTAAATLDVPGDFATIQACIDAAVSGVDECVVAPGTYHETINFLGKAITMRSSGGADVTTIDATGIGASVVTCASGEGPGTVLDGFAITGGTGTRGGGMYNDSSSPTVTNCTFSGNSATYGYGGGMYNDHSSPTVTNCTFSVNPSFNGGGMYNHGSIPTVTNCTFSGNTAIYYGGGMYNVSSIPAVNDCTFSGNTAIFGGGMYSLSSIPTVTNCIFSGNIASNEGGGMYNEDSIPTVTSCTFNGNKAPAGGGMLNLDNSSQTVTNCTFNGNIAIDDGGGMTNWGGSPTVSGCTFSRNAASYGGGMYNSSVSGSVVTGCTFIENTATQLGGGIFNDYSPTVKNCIFAGNAAKAGGGMYNHVFSNPKVINCTFSGNTANVGGGMYNNNVSSATVTNCTFSGNRAAYSGGGMRSNTSPTVTNCVFWGDSPDEVRNDGLYSAPTVRFSDVRGGLPIGVVDGGSNIDLDPIFVRPPDPGPDGSWDGVDDDYGDLRLRARSPCINAGDLVVFAQETDLEGHARLLCGGVDMGAYEFGIGDYDCDQVVDLADFSSWQACMTGPRDVRELTLAALTGPGVPSAIDNRQLAIGCEAFDFNADGDVDLLDFDAFQMIFGP